MAVRDMNKVEKPYSEDGMEGNRGDGKGNPHREAQLFTRKDGEMQSDKRPGMTLSDKNEEGTTETLHESFQHSTRDQHSKPAPGSTCADEQLFNQDHGLINLDSAGNEKDFSSDDIAHFQAIADQLLDQEMSRASHREIFESVQHANENYNDQNGDVMGNLASSASKGLLMRKDGQKRSRDSSSMETDSYSKDNPNLLKQTDGFSFSLNGANMDVGDSSNMNKVVEEEKMEWQETPVYQPVANQCTGQETPVYQPLAIPGRGHSFQDNREKSVETGFIKEKKARVLKESDQGKYNGNVPSDASDPLIPVENASYRQPAVDKVLKEGRVLKEKADSLKDCTSKFGKIGLYFQAALKFLQGAFLLEPCGHEIAELREITDSTFLYKEAAKLCEFVAHEFEKHKEPAAAALAYKCMEVANMRIVFAKAPQVKQGQNILGVVLQGESPSSPGSGSLHHRHPSVVAGKDLEINRVSNFVQDICTAMEASKNSLKALATAKKDGGEKCGVFDFETIVSFVEMAVGFNFHGIEQIIRTTEFIADMTLNCR